MTTRDFKPPALIAPRLRDAYLTDVHRYRAAAHEGGHAFSTISNGGTFNHSGVSIDGSWWCGSLFHCCPLPYWTNLAVTLSGDCAEFLLAGDIEPFASDQQLRAAMRPTGGVPRSDLEHAMAILRGANPTLSNSALFENYRHFTEQVYDILIQPRNLRAVEAIATALMRHGFLNADHVHRVYRGAMKSTARHLP